MTTLTSILTFESKPIQTGITNGESWIAVSPILIFGIILLSVFLKLKKDKVSLKDLLLDKSVVVEMEEQKTERFVALSKVDDITPETLKETVANNSASENSDPPKNTSVSRFLAFISGLISVGLSCVITSFYMWSYFDAVDPSKLPDLNNLMTVLLSLGIGVIPYAFNKLGSAIK